MTTSKIEAGSCFDISFFRSREYQFASKFAASAILARNMSHNIGSHVTPRTRLEDLRGRIWEFFLPKADDPKYWGESEWRIGFDVLKELKDTLDEYEQRKAEFIAEFSTDPLISAREAWFYREVIFPFLCNTALMDTLAANEGFHYRSADRPGIVIRCFREQPDGEIVELRPWFVPERLPSQKVQEIRWSMAENVQQPPVVPYGLRTAEHPSLIHIWSIDGAEHDVRVSLPGPVGEMAFYSILENLIRNAAKHGGQDDNKQGGGDQHARILEIHIVIRDTAGKATADEHYDMDILENLSSPDAVDTINGYINDAIVDDAGQVRNKAWGLAEMGLCANLLVDQAPGASQETPELRVDACPWERFRPEDSERKFLRYSLRLKKAWTAVFFGFDEVNEETRQSLRNPGFRFEGEATLFDPNREDGAIPPAVRFAVLDAGLIDSHANERVGAILNRLPFRIIVTGSITDTGKAQWLKKKGIACTKNLPPFGQGADDGKFAGELTRWLWREWLGYLGGKTGGEGVPLAVDAYFMQEENRKPTLDWRNAADRFNANEAAADRPIPARVGVWARDPGDGRVYSIAGKPPDAKGERRIIIDRHGDFAEKSNYEPSMKDRLIVIDKVSGDFDALYNASFPEPRDDDPWELPFELAEAGLVRILLLDERIAQRAGEKFQETGAGKEGFKRAVTGSKTATPLNWHIAERAGVYVATHLGISTKGQKSGTGPNNDKTLDLAGGSWLAPREAGSQGLDRPHLEMQFAAHDNNCSLRITAHRPGVGPQNNDELPRAMEDIDLVIIHQGILDRVREKFPGTNERLLSTLEECCWVIVESGRGIPPEVQKSSSKFLPFSLIERAFRGGRVAKLGLTRTVMAATRNKQS
uniref:Uncharacterized protein n=1 Tax=Candidatus Kentrum sp. DK TaxID=2126562 RepID=A0A450S2I9_9GAMM|nr:MAG: hypothetical protein BECKDK2373C_GA0170839_10132 [Candidatus Kentron sp. DK]